VLTSHTQMRRLTLMSVITRLAVAALITSAIVATFLPVVGFAFLNWDDTFVIVDNPALSEPGLVRWAFTTTYMEHYQPVSWLVWAGLRGPEAPDPARYHAANLVLHVLAVLLVWALTRQLLAIGQRRPSPPPIVADVRAEFAAAIAALLFGLHPLRVEVVAWVSALPYALATGLTLAAVGIWLRSAQRDARVSWLAVLVFAISLATRPLALGLPVVLVILDRWLLNRSLRTSMGRAVPFFVLALLAAGAEFLARAPGLADAPWDYRLQLGASAPFVYAWHTVAPVSLTPLDVLIGASLFGLVVITAVAWWWRNRWPAVLAGWLAYTALLAPAVGLVTSGLQATADRYTYLPGIVLAFAVAGAGYRWVGRDVGRGRIATTLALVAAAGCGFASREAAVHWSDSITLWTRVVEINPRNDIGLYNLGVALSASGQPDAAAERYRAVLAINSAHVEARQNLDRLDASRLEREANDLAAQGRLSEAEQRYQEALTRDPRRAHSHAARGMALATLGRGAEAVPHLREAVTLGTDDVVISNTLAGLLVEMGNEGEARAVLEGALKGHPNDLGLAHNLARLLVSLPGLPRQDRLRAFGLAQAVAQATGGQDARALDTLAASLAAIGRMMDAREINARAAAVATAQGDRELALQITARGRAFR
jgi:tetratricopeptide (TPR) repeat protein